VQRVHPASPLVQGKGETLESVDRRPRQADYQGANAGNPTVQPSGPQTGAGCLPLQWFSIFYWVTQW
jgi:hypothetical protein